MGASLFDTTIEEMVYNNSEVQTWIHNGAEVFSAGKMISYYVDTDSVYYEKFKKGTDCLNPTTFAPKKTGWTFVGWREDTTATPDVLKSKVVGSEEITLYAVFEQTVTANYSGNGNTGGSTAASTGKKHYNNGNTKSATITLRSNGFSKTYYGFSKWAMGSTSGTRYNAGASVTLTSSTTFYAIWLRSYEQQQVKIWAERSQTYTGRINFSSTFVSTPSVTFSYETKYWSSIRATSVDRNGFNYEAVNCWHDGDYRYFTWTAQA